MFGGSEIPQTMPDERYSFHPEPIRYPLTTASKVKGLSFFTTEVLRVAEQASCLVVVEYHKPCQMKDILSTRSQLDTL